MKVFSQSFYAKTESLHTLTNSSNFPSLHNNNSKNNYHNNGPLSLPLTSPFLRTINKKCSNSKIKNLRSAPFNYSFFNFHFQPYKIFKPLNINTQPNHNHIHTNKHNTTEDTNSHTYLQNYNYTHNNNNHSNDDYGYYEGLYQMEEGEDLQVNQLRNVYLGIGSNLGNGHIHLCEALKHLSQLPFTLVIDTSYLYLSEPMYVLNQPQFMNACVFIKTRLSPIQLLTHIKKIESLLGRANEFYNSKTPQDSSLSSYSNKIEIESNGLRKIRFGPRTIDIDILLFQGHQFRLQTNPLTDNNQYKNPSYSKPYPDPSPSACNLNNNSDSESLKNDRGPGPGPGSPSFLEIPHPRILERLFVLQPLLDLLQENKDTKLHHSFKPDNLIKQISLLKQNGQPSLKRIFPLSTNLSENPNSIQKNSVNNRFLTLDQKTLIMSIINMTPDSFSQEKQGILPSIDEALKSFGPLISNPHEHLKKLTDFSFNEYVLNSYIQSDIYDIGAESTRPFAKKIHFEEEINRVLPLIKEVRRRENILSELNLNQNIFSPISIDTYHPQTALEAVKAGANIINDVGVGSEEDKSDMIKIVRDYHIPYILMHSLGTPQNMHLFTKTYKNTDIVPEISNWFKQEIITLIQKHNIPRWSIIIDPGIGFGKDANQNLSLCRSFNRLKPFLSMPTLAGPSRKSFIKNTLQNSWKKTSQAELLHHLHSNNNNHKNDNENEFVNMNDRIWGTAAAVTACIQSGADIVRIHDLRPMRAVVDIADSIYRL